MYLLNMYPLNIYDSFILLLLFTMLPFIEKIIDFMSWLIIGLLNDIGLLIIQLINQIGYMYFVLIKFLVRCVIYYLMAVVYIYWLSLIIDFLKNIFCNNDDFDIFNIYDR